MAVNPTKSDSVDLGTIPSGKKVYVFYKGTFDVWGQPDIPGLYQDIDHGGGLWITAVAETGETVYSNWYKPPLALSGYSYGQPAQVLVSVKPRDINYGDNCCPDFKMGLAPVND